MPHDDLKLYYCNTFKGHWPVGTSAIVFAENEEMAIHRLLQTLEVYHLPQEETPKMVHVPFPAEPETIILQDGNY